MNNSAKIVQQISLLYELALTLGKSNDAEETCRSFLRTLCARKSLTLASVWVARPEGFQLLYAHPSIRGDKDQLPGDTWIWQQLDSLPYFSIDEQDPAFAECIHEKHVQGGCYAVFKLQTWGFLKLYVTHRKEEYVNTEMAQLRTVIDQFAASLSACFAYERLQQETRERLIAQKALASSKARIESLFQNMYDALIVQDEDGYITEYNKAASRLVEVEEVPHQQSKLMDFIHPDDRGKALRYAQQRKKRGFFSDLELRILTHSGNVKYVQINSNAIYEEGVYAGARDVIRDISGQKRAELQLLENENKLRQVIDTSLDGVVIVDGQERITEWSSQMETIFGFEKAEVLGRQLSDTIIPIQHRAQHQRGMNRYLSSGISHILDRRIELEALHKDGHEFPIELSVTHIKIEGKDFFSGFVRDITERKQAEHDLIAAKTSAEQARLAEAQFLANMSHEIRTPMNAVIGMTHLLYTTGLDATQKDYLDSLKFSADSLLGLINNVLDLSKIEAGMLEFERRKFDLFPILEGLQRTFQFKLSDQPIEVQLEIDPDIPESLLGDSTRLTQILTNLLGNASKFTQQGFIRLTAQRERRDEHQAFVCFTVTDTGIGIPPEKQETIFQNFKQANEKVARKYGGTGLGLSIVKQLVELQGGTISVQSELGQGASFQVRLPLEVADTALEVEPKHPLLIEQSEEERLQNAQILVAEDNPMNQKLIQKVFSIWNTPIELAENGLEVLQMCQKKSYDLILMDLHMPEMDGVEATAKIRAEAANPNHRTPIIALTAAALLDEKERALQSGMVDFLTKPFAPKMLKMNVLRWLSEKVPEKK